MIVSKATRCNSKSQSQQDPALYQVHGHCEND
jgi:hypothetical protein